MIERAVVIAEGPTVTLHDLPPELLPADGDFFPDEGDDESEPIVSHVGIHAERMQREQSERERLVRSWLRHGAGQQGGGRPGPGCARSTLLSRMKKHGLS